VNLHDIPRGYADPLHPSIDEKIAVVRAMDDFSPWQEVVTIAMYRCPECKDKLITDIMENLSCYYRDLHPADIRDRVHGLLCQNCLAYIRKHLHPGNVFTP
jgi:hypothetical protein